MPYGTIKVDNITFDNGGTDKLLTVSGLFFSTSGALTVTGTISGGNVVAPTATFTTLTGTTTAGTTATFTSGSFTSLTGVTTTVTSGIFGLGSAAAPSITFSGDPNTGIYSPGADQLAVATNGTEKLIILSNGNVGVGTSSPSSLAHIAGGGTGRRGALRFSDAGGTNYWEIGRDNGVNGSFTIAQNGTERLCIDYLAGNVGIGTSSPGSLLDVATPNSGITLTNTAVSNKQWRLGGNNSGYFLITETGVADRFIIDTSGNVGVGIAPSYQLQLSTDSAGKPSTNTWTIVSDERIKEDIELADLSLCYQAVKDIPLKRYKWKDEVYTEDQVHDRRKLGWISQDVKAVFPKAVRISEFKYNQVFDDETGELVSEDIIEDCHDLNADQLYAAMYGAVQMLMAKVETLEASNADMLARLSALEGA